MHAHSIIHTYILESHVQADCLFADVFFFWLTFFRAAPADRGIHSLATRWAARYVRQAAANTSS